MDDMCGPNVNARDSVHEKIYHLSTEKLIDHLQLSFKKLPLIFNYLKILYGLQVGHYPEPWLIHVYVQRLGYDQPRLGGPEH